MNAPYNQRWAHDEDVTAGNLYQEGVTANDVADTINRLYKHGRSTVAVRRRMHELGISWAACVDGDVYDGERRRASGHKSARSKLETISAAERRQPWHPARDPKPEWLRRRT